MQAHHRRTELLLFLICLVYAKIIWNKIVRYQHGISPNSETNSKNVNKHRKAPVFNDDFDEILPKQLPENYKKLEPSIKDINSVIIVAEYRTGSSFFSEIFNQHPESFYMYEPMSILKKHCDADTKTHNNTFTY